MVLAAEFGTGQVVWSLFYLFLFIVWFWLLIMIFGDLFSDPDESGWGKALWAVAVIAFNYLGVLVYLIVRGPGMGQRAMTRAQTQQAAMDDYIRSTAGAAGGPSPADQIAQAKQLLDSGTITQEEFEHLKRKALS